MIAGIRTYVYKPLEVARAESSRLHVQTPEVTRADSRVCKNGWKKEKLEETTRAFLPIIDSCFFDDLSSQCNLLMH